MRTQIIGMGVSLGVLLLASHGCAGGPEATDADVAPGEPAARADCSALITPAATDALGWPREQPVQHAGRCLLRTTGGELTVGTRAVPAPADERADAVQQELEAQCERLRSDGRHFVGQPDWLADGGPGCLSQVDPRTGTGVAELVFLNEREEVVQIRIAASTRLSEDAVESALEELARGSADLCEAGCA